MTWIESDTTIDRHPKKDMLAELLFAGGMVPDEVADYAALGLIHRLWHWAAECAKDGDLSGFTDRQIAKGCGWGGDPATLVRALVSCRLVDGDLRVHDWMMHTGSGIAKVESDAKRKRDARLAEKASAASADSPRPRRRTGAVPTDLPTNRPKERAQARESKDKEPERIDYRAIAASMTGVCEAADRARKGAAT